MSKKIMIDPGHAPGNANGGKNGYREYVGMWKLSNYLRDALIRCGCTAALTRVENEDPTLSDRGKKAQGYDLFIGEHTNAAKGAARGVEVYYSIDLPGDKAFAAALSKAVATLMGNPDRGAKIRESTNDHGEDYYTVMDSAQDIGVPHVLLIESGFHDNAQDEACLLKDTNLKAIAEAQAEVICRYLGVSYISSVNSVGTPIIGSMTATITQMKAWAESKKAATFFVDLAETFFNVAVAAGINPVVVYTQSAKETAYGRFGGVLDASYCNPCGLKINGGGDCSDPNAHKKFANWVEGTQAQVDHLALYAGAAGYPKAGTPDPRHFPYLKGTAVTVESLGGKWAPSATYGEDIVKMMRELEAVKVEEPAATVPLIIGGDTLSPKAENINGFWYVTLPDVGKVKIRDVITALGYTSIVWEESSKTIVAVK